MENLKPRSPARMPPSSRLEKIVGTSAMRVIGQWKSGQSGTRSSEWLTTPAGA
ncbi:hypothetical protein [Rhizobium aethiopicum]|uniref:hypothetical protein n=1 Tax=Rhizobium aethiopicum TaxID=1138170 RepID=UPI001428BF16|nr:hypothetical protein [Rhizobium aethiopicum]